jgi:hypothetical protein
VKEKKTSPPSPRLIIQKEKTSETKSGRKRKNNMRKEKERICGERKETQPPWGTSWRKTSATGLKNGK